MKKNYIFNIGNIKTYSKAYFLEFLNCQQYLDSSKIRGHKNFDDMKHIVLF